MNFETFIRRLSVNYPSMSVDQATSIFDAVFPEVDPNLEALRKRLTSTDDERFDYHVYNCLSWLDYDPAKYKVKAIKDLRDYLQREGFSGDYIGLKRIKDEVEEFLRDHPTATWPDGDPYR